MSHEFLLAAIIILSGALAGCTNFLYFKYKGILQKKGEVFRYILSGIGASILVPLLLNMLSSDLIKKSDTYNTINYFVFAGFCFVAGYFSDRFINSIGDKILKDIEATKAKVELVSDEVKKNEEKIDVLVSSETETDEEEKFNSEIKLEELSQNTNLIDNDLNSQVNKIVKSMNGTFKFRTATGIAKELKYSSSIVQTILNSLETNGVAKRFSNKQNKELWALTNVGLIMANKS